MSFHRFMRFKNFKKYLLSYIVIFAINTVNAQVGLCPSNLDFEMGDFTNWQCQAGTVDPIGRLILSPTAPIPGRHSIITAATAGNDVWGRFPEICPNGSGFSVKLGNSGGGHEAEGMSYTYTIPSTLTNFSMLFHYAVVLQDPSHQAFEQPRFRARITDVSTGLPIPCVDFDFIASASLPGFLPSPLGQNVFYKNWTPITINLTAFIGRTIKLEFITNDCVYQQHFGYAYVDVNTNCNGAITGNYICPGESSITLSAPFGFQSYKWYSDNTFTTILSNTQTLNLTPAPSVGSVFPVIVEPYTGFGCRDTLYATVSVAPAPTANAGPDIDICRAQQIQIGSTPNSIYSYAWTPAAQVSNPFSSNPLAWVLTTNPEEFIVKTTDILTGCVAYDTTYITPKFVDTAIRLSGKDTYCAGDPLAGSLSVNNILSSVQWYNGNTPIPGATNFIYQPTVSGNYWAQVQQNGCTDTTVSFPFIVNPKPISFAGPDASICTNNETIQLGTSSNPAYNYSWSPATQVSDASISNPNAWTIGSTTTEFIVETSDAITGCISYDTTYISGRVVDTSLLRIGKNIFCNNDPDWGTLNVSNALSSVQWYDNVTPIPGATAFNFRPLVTGNYWAEVQQNGCTDSTLTIPFNINAIPQVLFTPSSDTGCVTNNSFLFTNNSVVSDGAALNHLWKFSDGTIQTITDAVKSFNKAGNYSVKLITTTAFGCVDSSSNSVIHVLPNGKANFNWDSICINRPVSFYNLSNENGSSLVQYNWTFNNGVPSSTIKNPLPVIYPSSGQTDVTLLITALGCENDPDSITKRVQINVQKPGITYRTITVAQDYSQFIHVRDSVGKIYNWRPQTQLSSYNTQYTEFRAVNDVRYLIDITDKHTCVTTDTMQILVLKKPGYYLPTAFTPNGDGLNDKAIPYLVGLKSLKSFSIFNRWGGLVYYTQTEGQGWDGKYKGVPQSPGVFVWVLEFIDDTNKTVTEKGTIAIIR